MEMIGYIYKTINLQNGKIYIGQHQRTEFDPFYFGSGRILQNALMKYGKEAFKVEVLLWCESIDRLNEAEIDFIKAFNSTNKNNGYNLSFGGTCFTKGMERSVEHRKHLSESLKGRQSSFKGKHFSDESRKKLSEALKGKKAWNKGLTGIGKGRKCSEETKQRMSRSAMGKPGTRKGVKVSKETLQKMRLAHIGKTKGSIPWNKGRKGFPWTEARREAEKYKKNILNKDLQIDQTNNSNKLEGEIS